MSISSVEAAKLGVKHHKSIKESINQSINQSINHDNIQRCLFHVRFRSTSTLSDPNPNKNPNPYPNCYICMVAKWKIMGHARWLSQYLTSGVRHCIVIWCLLLEAIYFHFFFLRIHHARDETEMKLKKITASQISKKKMNYWKEFRNKNVYVCLLSFSTILYFGNWKCWGGQLGELCILNKPVKHRSWVRIGKPKHWNCIISEHWVAIGYCIISEHWVVIRYCIISEYWVVIGYCIISEYWVVIRYCIISEY
jgi:hypothetical protein